jgi:hypothetical protein
MQMGDRREGRDVKACLDVFTGEGVREVVHPSHFRRQLMTCRDVLVVLTERKMCLGDVADRVGWKREELARKAV